MPGIWKYEYRSTRLYNLFCSLIIKGQMSVTDIIAIRAQLAKILSSPVFLNSPRMTRFLKFVVETTLEGNSARIKEYVIAIEVFEKSEAYDPQADSTVRSEASKLRARLLRYYETDGQQDAVVISIPKGSYVPAFDDRRNGDAIAQRGGGSSRIKVAAIVLAAVTTVAGIVWLARTSPSPAPRLIPLTSYPELEEQPSLSPDGSQVAFSWKGDIYVKQVGSEAVLQITKNPAVDSWPAWSPDATQIAFIRGNEVFVVSPLGGGERKVAESAGRVAWTTDGSALLVLEKTSALAQSIFQVTLAGGEKRRLTFPRDSTIGDLDMATSPDGRTIAFCRSLQTQGCELFVAPAAGGEAHRLTNDQRNIHGLAWTPDGREIIFASNRQSSFRLWRVRARPSAQPGAFETPRLVEAASDDARYPSISRTAKLAYQRSSISLVIRRAEIAGAEGSAAHRLSPSRPLIASTRREGAPAWSPDGRKIAFVSDRSGDFELWICDADGSNPLKLTTFGGSDVVNPRWSPDGQRLIFSALTGPGGNFEGYFINAKGGPAEPIPTLDRRSMAFPKFSHDGRWIYFIPGPQERAVEAWKIPAAGGEAVQITHDGAFFPEDSQDGKLLYYGKFGTNGLWSTPVRGGEERQVLNAIDGVNWAVTSKGIYYFKLPVAPNAPKLVKFYDFKSGASNQVGTVEPSADNCTGISVSPDGRWLLYSDVVNTTSDLMLVERFR